MRNYALLLLVSVCVAIGALAACVSVTAEAKATERPDTALQNLQLPDVRLTSITRDEAPAAEGTGRVTYYEVEGVIGGTIQFELLLPDEWNQRLVMGGGGGFVGTVQNAMRNSVRRGYATVGTDTGHQGFGGSFALDDALAQVNFGHVAVHRTVEVAKAIIRAHYDADPAYSYFLGCSRGGGQAMMASQRYPEDFNGIVAGAPAFDWTGVGATFLQITQAFYPDPDVLDRTVLTNAELARLIDDVVLLCDEQDGLADGIISDPANVAFSLDSITWLNAEQRAAIRSIYDGPRNQNGQIHPGFPVGSEIDWFNWLVGPMPNAPAPSLAYGFGVDIFKYFVFNDPDWDYSTYDFSTFDQDSRLTASTLNAVDTDLSAFSERGGKLILWHGWSDAALSATATVEYYEELLATDPNAEDYTRLYLIPGCRHCGGGPGVSNVDWLDVIVRWIEQGQAPDAVIASKPAGGDSAEMTRPLSAYPMRTVYKGSGNPNSADNFESVRDMGRL